MAARHANGLQNTTLSMKVTKHFDNITLKLKQVKIYKGCLH